MNVKILTPTVPNFLSLMISVRGKRQDGFQESPKVRVGDLTNEQLEAVARDWRHELFNRAELQRKNDKERGE